MHVQFLYNCSEFLQFFPELCDTRGPLGGLWGPLIILVLQTSRTIPYKVNNAGGGEEEPQVNGNQKNYFF